MPELPEVETVVTSLKAKVLNLQIKEVVIYFSKVLKNSNVVDFSKKLENQKILDVKRRGKNIVFYLDDYVVLSHLRMEGKYYYNETSMHRENPHYLFTWVFSNGYELNYHDTRRFGTIHLYGKKAFLSDNIITPLTKLGPEPFDQSLNHEYLIKQAKNRRITIKQFLLDQSNLVGIGNIYVDEILFACKINPTRPVNQITIANWDLIIKKTRLILRQAIDAGGTTFMSFSHSNNISGRFQQQLKVYGKKNESCPNCRLPISKIKVGQRGTHYCANCQN